MFGRRPSSGWTEQRQIAATNPGYTPRRSLWVIIQDPEQEATICVAIWALILSGLRFRELKLQRELLAAGYFTKEAGIVILPSDAREYLRTFEQLPPKVRNAALPRVLAAALKRFGATGNVQDASQTVHNTCESEHNRLDAELAILRFSVWVAPAIGFIGTVRGIGIALEGADLAVRGDTSAVTGGLGIAFNSTLVALTLSIALMYVLHEIQLVARAPHARHRELRRGRADQPFARRLRRQRAIIRQYCGSVLPQLITRASARFAAIAPVFTTLRLGANHA